MGEQNTATTMSSVSAERETETESESESESGGLERPFQYESFCDGNLLNIMAQCADTLRKCWEAGEAGEIIFMPIAIEMECLADYKSEIIIVGYNKATEKRIIFKIKCTGDSSNGEQESSIYVFDFP